MENLSHKYRTNKLNSQELMALRKEVNASSDEELENQLLQVWEEEDFNEDSIKDVLIKRMKEHIDHALPLQKRTFFSWIHYGQIVAAVLLPFFMLWSFYLYYENSRINPVEMIISTGKGERADILLPDSSQVSLNALSRLSYRAKEYNQSERTICFNGEGYFKVYKIPKTPFIIQTPSLQVNVLGTTFNLHVRNTEQLAELTLEEGSVLLVSVLTQNSVILKPREKAIVNQSTGDITVIQVKDISLASAWKRGELIFRNSKLTDILQTMEKTYDVSFRVNCKQYLNNTFTGTLPSSHLNEALEIIELTYGIKASIKGKEIDLNAIN